MQRSSFGIAFVAASALAGAPAPAQADTIWYRCGDDICRIHPDGTGTARPWGLQGPGVGELDVTRNGRRIAFVARGNLVISDRRRSRLVGVRHPDPARQG